LRICRLCLPGFNEYDVVHNDKLCVLATRALFYTALIIHMLSFSGIPILSVFSYIM